MNDLKNPPKEDASKQEFAKQGPTLFEALLAKHPECSKNSLRIWLKHGRVIVAGRVVRNGEYIVKPGETFYLGQRVNKALGRLPVVYEDAHIVVVDKPQGLLSVATVFDTINTAHAILKETYRPKRVYVVHRLDREVSGLLVFALTEEACQGLKEMLKDHSCHREYYAIVEGRVKEPKGIWKSHLLEDANYVVASVEDPEAGQLAITHYTALKTFDRHTHLSIELETGRKNQIRVHCKEAGHPIVGDVKYGARGNLIKRLCLHACKLSFTHPVTGKPMVFTSPLPESFARIK